MATLIRRVIAPVFSLWLALLVSSPAVAADTASLYLSPSKTSVTVGESFSIAINVSAPIAVNALSARVSVPNDLLDITGTSRDGSIISFWVGGPSSDRSTGIVSLEGVALNPGFEGSRGLLLNINVRAKRSGVANISFLSGSVLANDGAATNVLGSLGRTAVAIAEVGQPAPPIVTGPAGEAPTPVVTPAVISSTTHADPKKWYAATTGEFRWVSSLPVLGSNYIFDNAPNTTLSAAVKTTAAQATINNIKEGVSYLHVRVRTSSGWAATSHFKIQVDTTEPDSLIVSQAVSEAGSDKAVLMIRATDKLSGIDRFDIIVDSSDPIIWRTIDGRGTFTTPNLSAGPHEIKISAVDQAGNQRTESIAVSISPKLNLTLSLFAREFCDRYCFNMTQQIIAWSLLILILILIILWQKRRWVKKELVRLERDVVKLEQAASREFKHLEKVAGQEVRSLERAVDHDIRAVEKSVQKSWLGMFRHYRQQAADRRLHERYELLYEGVEREILTLEEKKARHGLVAHEAHRLKELMEVLHDVRELRHHE